MTKSKDIQIRGHCQRCGRHQAIQRGNMAKHGYTVEHGYFQGVCYGNQFEPIETSRAELDNMCAVVDEDVLRTEAWIAKLQDGSGHPKQVYCEKYEKLDELDRYGKNKWGHRKIDWADANERERRSGVASAILQSEQHARSGRFFAEQMRALADKVHGQPVMEVPKPRSGPLIHWQSEKHPRWTACNSRIEGMGYRSRYLHTTKHKHAVTCEKCKTIINA